MTIGIAALANCSSSIEDERPGVTITIPETSTSVATSGGFGGMSVATTGYAAGYTGGSTADSGVGAGNGEGGYGGEGGNPGGLGGAGGTGSVGGGGGGN